MCENVSELCRYSGRGLIHLLILRVLHEQPLHGYEIMNELEKMTNGRYVPESGAIYTMLRRMEGQGQLSSRWDRRDNRLDRRVYSLTELGRRSLKVGLRTVKERKPVLDALVRFYDSQMTGEEVSDS